MNIVDVLFLYKQWPYAFSHPRRGCIWARMRYSIFYYESSTRIGGIFYGNLNLQKHNLYEVTL